MKLKIVDGHAVVQDGHPVYVYEDGREAPFNAQETLESLTRRINNLTEEKDRHFKKADELAKKLKAYENIDPAKFQEYEKIVKNLNDKQLLDERGIEELKKTMRSTFEEEKAAERSRYEAKLKEQIELSEAYKKMMVDLALRNRFATCEFFAGDKPKTIYSPEDAYLIFGRHFELDIDPRQGRLKMVAKDNDNQTIMSKINHGEPAGFDEAIAILVEQRARKHAIMRSTGPGGPTTIGNVQLPHGKSLEQLSPVERIRVGLQQKYKMG